ncbi:MAG: class I SAM-dependent methyltransferase [Actinobacteria bacterium]|jgi:SAM-dependent methyltransferase|nr:class I SAM-dependent methyltransferase [Actinomycetota bacterium]MBT3745713.1 class I SAM-dependent methyltransferase [Actinomycetota bacterium]MBT3969096.1 class I SAM-dependent methyltransferase [Actinomycetota bacterium]MBT4009653.1 class I SAM-dependent methyltransferase [Actinomycetota bacterium]MBT4302161.1 class I SAM-dependent methyltransferase [Actinomycetota bacterium]
MTSAEAPNGTGIARLRLLWKLFRDERQNPEPFYRALAAESAIDLSQRYGLAQTDVLDIGCGPGWYAEALRQHQATVVGIDGSVEALTRANPPITGLSIGDATRLAFPDASFDGVFCSNMLEHVSDPEAVIDEMVRVLRPGGWGYLSWTNWYSPHGGHHMNPYQYLGTRWGPRLYEKRHGPPPDNRFGKELFAVHIGPTLRFMRNHPQINVHRVEPRYWPWARPITAIPLVREVFTWNCLVRFTRQDI